MARARSVSPSDRSSSAKRAQAEHRVGSHSTYFSYSFRHLHVWGKDSYQCLRMRPRIPPMLTRCPDFADPTACEILGAHHTPCAAAQPE
jgi:hypothetical protein